ncbi:phosphomannomutase/phosphoglucomutase [Brevibacillus massiliensis]|uniref:phosphomannomutase/phosphoglucomutase n=1 Tax=Brevibacillus massiliensis TaxID=1118054 RepID=UPI000372A1A4
MSLLANKEKSIPAHVFREYDIRGRAGEEITPSFSRLLGRAFGEKSAEAGSRTVIVGHDNRLSSPQLHQAAISGLLQSGCDVIDIGEVTTPMFYYALEHFQTPSGVMITASHNPGEDNGFKVALDYSTIYGRQIQDLRERMYRMMDEEDRSDGQHQGSLSSVRREDVERPYLQMLKEKIQLGPRNLKVVVDCGNGTASSFAPKALRAWGCQVVELYCESDPRFPHHHPDPVDPKNVADLIEKVKAEQADIGIAFDGDGDRLGVVDEQGNIRWGDQLMILFWREILPRYPGCEALVEVKCSKALIEEIEKLGGRPIFHRTGHSYIKATMRSRGCPFTGEMSGHLFFRDEYYGFDDALYAAGRLLRILSRTEKELSALFADVPRYFSTPETRVSCDEREKAEIISKVKAYFAGSHEIVDVDGVRVLFPDGWGLVRSSNTQPILVLRAEAETEAGLARIKSEVERALTAASRELRVAW